jgi:16S rRNA (guanine527-N7)-methyltransferase
MHSIRIAELLRPFTREDEPSPALVEDLSSYLDLLLKWNARVNLTAIRAPEQIVTRHFGESLFAAQLLFRNDGECSLTVADVGSGAGFPGIPLKLWAPQVQLTLIESQNKKATFLREVIRTLTLEQAEVFIGRAEEWGQLADVVTMRAVEKFERSLPVAAGLVAPGGRLGLLIGAGQFDAARQVVGDGWRWHDPVAIPQSEDRVVAVANRN